MQTEVLIKKLKNRSINPTAMRLLVLEKLMKTDIALSLADLEIEMEHADRVTIYRTLKKFEENKLIHSIEDGTGSVKYALCDSDCKCTLEFSHAHFHCNYCDRTYCLKDIHLPVVELPNRFVIEQSSFVLKGVCAFCKH